MHTPTTPEIDSADQTLTFQDFSLSPELNHALKAMGFQHPSPIQAQSVPLLLSGQDVIGQAQTGTGKTAAFAIPIIEGIIPKEKRVQALVLCPTRELALQITAEFQKLTQFKRHIRVATLYGGQPIERQIRALGQFPQIVIGTPGRVLDLIRRSALTLYHIRTAVLDEADEMLNMGFRKDIETILQYTPTTRQTVLFSATMPQSILDLTHRIQKEAIHIKAARHNEPVPEIEQLYFEVDKSRKFQALRHVLDNNRFALAIVFCNTKWKVDAVVKRLQREGCRAEGLHGGMTQSRRDKIMAGFRKGHTPVLVATDVAARGIDVQNVEAVINFDVPKDTEFYVHRIGRTGRAGKTGQAFTFVEQAEYPILKEIRKYPNVRMTRQQLPNA